MRGRLAAPHPFAAFFDPTMTTISAPSARQPDIQQALHSLGLIVRSTRQHGQQVRHSTGLSSSQQSCLAALETTPGLRVTQLAHALGVRQATASKLVDGLEQLGLVERRRDPQDLRVVHLHLTPDGLRKAEGLPPMPTGLLPEALGRMEPPMLDSLNTLLDELIGLMKLQDRPRDAQPLGG